MCYCTVYPDFVKMRRFGTHKKVINSYVPDRDETSGLSIAMIRQHHYIHINALCVNANNAIDSKSFPAKHPNATSLIPALEIKNAIPAFFW